MADIADLAQEDIERNAPGILAASRKPAGPVPCGACHYCQEPLPEGMPFCDAEHRDAWQREEHLKKQRVRD